MPDTVLQLGDFAFARFEVPEQITFGGEQQLVTHKLIGGVRVIDAMGDDPMALEWSGHFVGAAAMDRALYLDGQRKAGRPLTLTWDRLSYSVTIRALRCTFQRFYRLPYSIVCEVVTDHTAPVKVLADPSPEQLVDDDLGTASDLASGIGDAALIGLMAALTAATATIGPLTQASPSSLAMLAGPVQAVRSRAATLLAVTAINGTVGGVVAGGDPLVLAASLTAQASAISGTPALVALDRTLGRVQANLAAFGAGTRNVTTAGGDLFTIAADQYGDARAWTALADANGLIDPALAGIVSLAVPPLPARVDGILNG